MYEVVTCCVTNGTNGNYNVDGSGWPFDSRVMLGAVELAHDSSTERPDAVHIGDLEAADVVG